MEKNFFKIAVWLLLMALVLASFTACQCQHRDADDDSLCDKCGETYTDGKDIPEAPVCQHRDVDDDSLCDKCNEAYEDGKDLPNGSSAEGNDNIHYSVNVGTKIEDLSEEKQSKIDNYATDCKTFLINGYKNSFGGYTDGFVPYIAITDTFVYDFGSIDDKTENETLLKRLKQLRKDGALPLMYIEYSGYVSLFRSNYKNIPLSSSGRMVGFFVFEDGAFIALNYEKMCASIYYYAMPANTVCINCGDTYSEELDANALKVYDKALTHLKEYE